ncbi:uridine kinase [Erysipelothrix rhusiopathiae]|uniref:Uridine kinase n=2 Tax=Erysipelothrix TaxID=1647 RepID=E7FTY0_ERYRH|nr:MULTISPECIES: uridine kinase [Erysipelothrix]UPU39192.1 uridine kinase [Erysipelothrix sp. Poltava]CAH2761642.1 uridine kinase [Erysipelothrix sp. A18Y020d]AGN23708.1 uridine/cytidine kinase [Erysipelothrix rhusiopathiae SY1027]AMS11516.1 uridine kinase [Erysipelothrix rhusiopathiae]AOO68015.1 uridine kinase [Erysipelothrix rhusiopathiae]
MSPIVIGIAGGSASGKSSIAKKLKKHFDETQKVVIIKMDDYYKDQSHLPMEERLATNYDHPFAFDMDLLVSDMESLKSGVSIQKPVYDFMNHTRSQYSEEIQCNDVIVLEGLMTLDDARLRDLLDIKVFVDAPADIRFIRRLVRDVNKRGRTLEHVIEQYMSTVRIMHEQFVEPSKRYADIIIPEGAHNTVAIDLLTTKISSIIGTSVL